MIQYSVVIPTYNSAECLRACLGSLFRQTVARSEYEIIVVDDGSSDHTEQVVKSFPGVHTIRQANQGPAVARNRGAAAAAGSILLFIDADCEAFPDWMDEMTQPFTAPGIAGVKGAYQSRQTGMVAQVVQAEYEIKYDRMRRESFIDFIDTYSAGFRKEIFEAAGGYDTRFRQASVEDQEFSFRLAGRGCKMIFNPKAKVWHRHADTLGAYCRKKWKIGFWKVRVLQRHPGKMVRDSHTPQLLKLEIVCQAAGMMSGLIGIAGNWPLLGISGAGLLLAPLILAGIELGRQWRTRFFLSLAAVGVFYLRSACLGFGLLCGMVTNLGTGNK